MKEKNVSFCMRCFHNSAVHVKDDINFCHYCGSEGTCIAIKGSDAIYLREQIQNYGDRRVNDMNIRHQQIRKKTKKTVKYRLRKIWRMFIGKW
jgi:hypothetical protein